MTDELDELAEIFSPVLKREQGEDYTVVSSNTVKPFKERSVSDILTEGTGELLPDVMPKARRRTPQRRQTAAPEPKPTSKELKRGVIMADVPAQPVRPAYMPYRNSSKTQSAADTPEPFSMGPATIHDGANRWPATVIKLITANTCQIVEDTVSPDPFDSRQMIIIAGMEGNKTWRVARNTDGRWRIVGGPRHIVTFKKREYATTVF